MPRGVNLRVLRREIAAQARRQIEDRAQAIVEKKMEVIKNQTLREFDSDPITGELEAKDHLFGFLGFYESEEPQDELREYLENSIETFGDTKTFTTGNKIIVRQTISTPSLDSIYAGVNSAGVQDWTNKSWVQLIEEGIPHFARYLFGDFSNSGKSRSKVGLQAKNDLRGGSYGARKYISKILADLRARIKKTQR